MKRIYTYKLTINAKYWQDQLRTGDIRFTQKDRKLLKKVKYEKHDNSSLKRIHQKALSDGFFIPCLTEMSGDCMFESLEHTGLCDDRVALRKMVATLFFLFGESSDVLPGYDDPLKIVFTYMNDIPYVYCHEKKKLYAYTYYTMCSDMFTEGEWSRLPTHLVLILMSTFFKVRFHIYHDSGHITTICDESMSSQIPEDDDSCNLRLGLVGEHHYVPLIRRTGNASELNCPKYNIELIKFHKWARERADVIGLYEDFCESSDENMMDTNAKDDNDDDNSPEKRRVGGNQNAGTRVMGSGTRSHTPTQSKKSKSSDPDISHHNPASVISSISVRDKYNDFYNNLKVDPFATPYQEKGMEIPEKFIKSEQDQESTESEKRSDKGESDNNLVFF